MTENHAEAILQICGECSHPAKTYWHEHSFRCCGRSAPFARGAKPDQDPNGAGFKRLPSGCKFALRKAPKPCPRPPQQNRTVYLLVHWSNFGMISSSSFSIASATGLLSPTLREKYDARCVSIEGMGGGNT